MGWESLPARSWIDSVTSDHPVFVSRLDGHMALANSLAMKIAGIDRKVKDVTGGTIERDARGELTGIFKDNAMDLISVKIPEQSAEEIDIALVAAMKYLASNGVTSVHALDAAAYADGLDRVRASGRQITRIYYLQTISRWADMKEQVERAGRGDRWLSTGGVKGLLTAHSDHIRQPSSNRTPIYRLTPDFSLTVSKTFTRGFQLLTRQVCRWQSTRSATAQ